MQRRRILLGLTAAGLLPCGGRLARAAVGASPLSLLVAGPDGERISRWGNACALALSPGLPGAPVIIPQSYGGLDGVTGANRLDALVPPDGKTAAILPGAAMIAWLAGDDRVHFDPTRWEPVLAGLNSGVLVVRLGSKPPSLQTLRGMAPLRLAAAAPESNDLAALLALQRMGVATAPVFGLHGRDAKINAFVTQTADAVFLAGEGVPEDIAPLAANGGVPVFCLGTALGGGTFGPDPLFPGLPDAITFSGIASSPLDAAYQAAAAAAAMDFVIVLPRLTDPGAVAQWRMAATRAAAAPALAAAARASSIALQPAPSAAVPFSALNMPAADQAGLQAFLTSHFGWQPG